MKSDCEMIESNRIVLSPFAMPDAAELLGVFRDPDVRRYLLDDTIMPPEWLYNEIAASNERLTQSGAGLWSVRLKGHDAIIGFAGFCLFFDPPQLQLIYGLLPGYWGRGLATEAAALVCDYAFQKLGFEKIVAAIDIPNQASAAVMRRLGMKQIKTSDDGIAGTICFMLTREMWFAKLESRGTESPPEIKRT